MIPTPFTFTTEKRQNRSLIHDVTPFLNNIIFQYTNPIPFETEPYILHTIPLVREHPDSYLYYIRYKTFDITPSQTPFQVIFNPVKGINSGTFHRTIHPKNITLSIQDVFNTYMQKLIEFNENQDTPLYRPSHLQELKHRSEYFEVPDLDTKVQRHNNPHYWLQRDIVQIKHFQYRFFNNIILTDDTIPQVKIFTQFLLKFLRFNFQLIWEQKDQQAYVNFPHILTQTELLPYIIQNENKHLHYRDLTSLNVTHLEQINLDSTFILEHSETSDNRPFTTSDTSHETTPEEQTSSVEPLYTRQESEQSEQESSEQEAFANIFHNPDSPQEQLLYSPQLQAPDIQQTNPSETNTIHNTSEFSEETVQNTQSLTITDDSNRIIIPTHNITQNDITNQGQDNTSNINQDNTSMISTSNTNITQPSQTQILSPRNYNPPSVPPQFSTQINTHNSPQPSSSNTHYIAQNTNTVHFHTPTPPSSSEIQTSTYTPAQTNPVQTTQPTLNINTIHSNPSSNYTTARHLSRPPLQPILTNPLSCSLTSTNPNPPQQAQINYNTSNQLNALSSQHTSNTINPTLQTSQFHISNPPSTTIRTNPHFQNTATTSLTNISNIPTYNTTPPSTITPNTMSHPTYINSSTSISEPIKPFDGLDHNYTPEEYLQHIEARVTFSLGLQPTLEHEYKFWHARRMAFIQCSLTGTALSWYIRSNDTYKHDWHAFVQAFKKQFSSQKNAYYAQVEALNLTKKDNETVRHFALKVQQLVEKGWCNENASTINLKCNEIFTKGLPKNLKDFAIKRQVKHTSTVLEPSIPFHTLVKLVDAEDIANDKIRTHDLALEINNITKQLNTQTLDHSSQEQLMYTQPKDPKNKNKPAYKKYCSYCHRTNHSISACFKKQRDDEDKREAYARSKYPQKSFVQYFRSPSNDRTKQYDNRYRNRSTSRDNSYNRNYPQNRYRSTSRDRDRFRYDKSTTPPHYSRSRYDTYKRDSRSYRSPYRSSYRSPYRQNSRPRYRSRSYSRDNKFTKYTNSYRPPSRPRDSRFSRSRSHSNSRNKINMIQQQDQTDPIKFEVHMYHPTAMANAVTPTSWFYTLYVHTPSSIVQRDNPSRLEIAFLLDSGASISVLNYPTYITLTKLLDIKSNHTSDVGPTRNFKTLTVANQTEVPILHYANIILNTTIDENSRYFSVPFAVADIKYNILETPFFEDNIQNINIQDFTLEFKYQSKTHPNYTKFTTLLSKDYPYFSYNYRINSKTQIRLKPKSSKIAHFPIKNYHNLHFTTTPQNHFFPSVPHTYFATKFRTNFNFIEVFTDDKPDICATIIQNTSKHVATLPTGHIGYIEVPITNEKPKFFQVNDINTLIHIVTHTYHPDITEPLPQTNYIVQYDDPTTPPPQFSLHQIYMTNDDIPNQTSLLYNVQPTSHTSEKRIFPSLPYTSENLKFINKFNFQFSDLTDTEYITLCNMLLKYKTCYATHKNDVGKISTPFRIRLKPNAQFMTQRPSKVPIHYRDRLNVLLKELEKYNIIKQIGSSPQDKPVYGTTYLNPPIIIPKGDTLKCVLDARHLNSNTIR